MSNNAGFEVSIKEYAAQRGKTIQAVYQQMKRKENAEALKGHVILRRVGNKDVKYLDDVAVSILDHASNSAPLTIREDGLKDKLVELDTANRTLEKSVHKLEGQVELLQQLLAEKTQQLLLLAEPQSQIDALTQKNASLSLDNQNLEVKVEEAEKTAERAKFELSAANKQHEDEVYLLKQELEAEKNRKLSLEERLFGRKRKKQVR